MIQLSNEKSREWFFVWFLKKNMQVYVCVWLWKEVLRDTRTKRKWNAKNVVDTNCPVISQQHQRVLNSMCVILHNQSWLIQAINRVVYIGVLCVCLWCYWCWLRNICGEKMFDDGSCTLNSFHKLFHVIDFFYTHFWSKNRRITRWSKKKTNNKQINEYKAKISSK